MKKTGFLVSMLILLSCAGLQAQGLKFSGQTVTIHERTSADVFAHSAQTFRDNLDISFQFCSYPTARFGYIVRMHDRKAPEQILNLSFDGRGNSFIIKLNEEGRHSIVQVEIPEEEYRDFTWVPVNIHLDAVKDSVSFNFGGRKATAGFAFGVKRLNPSIQFGLSGHVVDVPSFAIKDLRISDSRRTVSFPLDETEGNVIRDSKGRKTGSVKNPNWLMAESGFWKKVTEMDSDSPGGVIYAPKLSSVLLYNSETLKTFDIAREMSTVRQTKNRCPMQILLGTCFLEDDKLIAYELNDWLHNNEGNSVASLDLQTLEWTALSTARLDGQMHHHGAFINPDTGEYTFFGGFGNMYYNGSFIALGEDNRWHVKWDVQKDGSTLYPRFFASAGLDESGNYAYLFGGMGNESGEQIVGRRYFYDLHRVDIRTGECRRLWDLDYHGEDFVPARNLVVDGEYIYVLCYPEYLTESVMHLYRFSIADGSYEVLADGIKVNSDKIWCSSSLYLDRDLGKFIVAASNVNDELKPHVDIYTLLYPPCKLKERSFLLSHKTILFAALATILAAAYWGISTIVRRRLRAKKEAESYSKSKADQRRKLFHQSKRPNSICLFGEFMVTDREGNDVSDTFSRQQRALLFLLMKYRTTGLSSSRMSSILWPDKEEDKVKNSRGVAVNSLRKSLSRLDGFSISYSGGLFNINIEDPGYCDLDELSGLTPENGIDGMLQIISRGRFLQGLSDPEFDSFKDQVESSIAPVLADEIEKRFNTGQYRAAIEIADMILSFDPLDEKALHYAVQSLLAIKRRDDALLRYASFTAEYLRTNDEVYPVKFEKV